MLCEFQNLNFFPLNVVLNSVLKDSCWLHFMYGQKSISCYMHSKNSRVLKFINQTMKFTFYIDFFSVIYYIIRREMDLSRKPYTPCLRHSFDPFSIEGRNSLVLFKILVTQCIEESPSNILYVLAITSFASCIYACMFSLFLFYFYKINLVFLFNVIIFIFFNLT